MSNSSLLLKLNDYAQLMRLDKPIGTLLLAWPTLWSLWLAGMQRTTEATWLNMGIQPLIVVIFLCGVFLMRSAGCVINDFADRDIDKHVDRTQTRPLTSGRVRASEALILFLTLVFCALLLVLSLEEDVRWVVLLWAVPALLCAIAYPFMKRFFATPQLVLGIAFSFAIPMTYAAYGHGWEMWQPVLLLVVANMTWVVAYDTQYAMVDRVDDVKVGVRSTAIFFGKNDVMAVVILQCISLLLLIIVGCFYALNHFYYAVLAVAAMLFIYQFFLIKGRDQKRCFMAFLNNAWFGAMVWFAILLGTTTAI